MDNIDLKPEVLAKLQRIVLSGERLDELAKFHGLERERYWRIFKESDKALLARVIAKAKESK